MSAADFRLVKPVAITDAMLVSSSVPEALVTAYDPGITYALGDIRGVTVGTAQTVYQSLQAGNIGHTPASSPTWWKAVSTLYLPYAAGTTYAAGAVVSNIAANVHELYESQVGSNLGNALTDKTKWLRKSATNRWNMFDKILNSQTIWPNQVSVSIAPGLVNTVTILNAEAASITVTQSISGYSETKSLVRHDVLNWYDFYYQEPIRTGDVVFDGIPPYAASTLTITANNAGLDAAIGGCFVGKSRTIGQTQWEATGGILSYSTIATDKFGGVSFVERPNAKRLNFEVRIPEGFESEAFRLLTQHSNREIIVIGSTDYSMLLSYCYLEQWDVAVSDSGKNTTISTRGLT